MNKRERRCSCSSVHRLLVVQHPRRRGGAHLNLMPVHGSVVSPPDADSTTNYFRIFISVFAPYNRVVRWVDNYMTVFVFVLWWHHQHTNSCIMVFNDLVVPLQIPSSGIDRVRSTGRPVIRGKIKVMKIIGCIDSVEVKRGKGSGVVVDRGWVDRCPVEREAVRVCPGVLAESVIFHHERVDRRRPGRGNVSAKGISGRILLDKVLLRCRAVSAYCADFAARKRSRACGRGGKFTFKKTKQKHLDEQCCRSDRLGLLIYSKLTPQMGETTNRSKMNDHRKNGQC